MKSQQQEQYDFIEKILKLHLRPYQQVEDFQFFYGGNFNLAVKVRLDIGDYFIKWSKNNSTGRFETEAKNLSLMAATHCIALPKVWGYGHIEEKEYLIMEGIVSAPQRQDYWSDFGQKMAQLHRCTNTHGHGLHYDNYIGNALQNNAWKANGVQFYIENRLRPQLELADYNRRLDAEMLGIFDRFFQELPNLIPNEQPALVHGDLWTGNLMSNAEGQACLVDPACYYGLREADLAFSTMFGGFEPAFYEAYHGAYPIAPGFHARIPYYNLYPLLVHVNLFGEGYLPAIKAILKPFH